MGKSRRPALIRLPPAPPSPLILILLTNLARRVLTVLDHLQLSRILLPLGAVVAVGHGKGQPRLEPHEVKAVSQHVVELGSSQFRVGQDLAKELMMLSIA